MHDNPQDIKNQMSSLNLMTLDETAIIVWVLSEKCASSEHYYRVLSNTTAWGVHVLTELSRLGFYGANHLPDGNRSNRW